jgi:hypothetical protein
MMLWLWTVLLVGLLSLGLSGCDGEKTVMWNDYPIHIKEVKLHEPGRIHGNSTLLDDGRILISGGYHEQRPYGPHKGFELLDPATGKSEFLPLQLNTYDYFPVMKLDDSRVLITQAGDTHLVFDPETKTLKETGPMLTGGRMYFQLLLEPEGSVLFLGGWPSATTVERYNPKTDRFSKVGELLYPVRHHTAFWVSEREALLIGGDFGAGSGDLESGAQLFNTETGETKYLPLNWPAKGSQNQSIKLKEGLFFISDGLRSAWLTWPEQKLTPIWSASRVRFYGFAINTICNGYVITSGKDVYDKKSDVFDLTLSNSERFQPFIPFETLMSPIFVAYQPGKFFIQSGYAGKAFLIDVSSIMEGSPVCTQGFIP